MPHNFQGVKNKINNFRKGYFTDPYDEPVFLTFALDFTFEDLTTSMRENNLWSSPLFNGVNSPGESAVRFLKNRGYPADANALAVFKNILRYLTFDAPWYFQKISGLDTMWRDATDMEGGYKAKNAVITVNTLEAIDLRITELASIYRKAIFDKVHMREKVPDNLRWFSMDIYVAEARNLRYRLPGIGQNIATALGVNTGAIGNIVGAGNIFSDVLSQYGYVKFRCRQCEFDFSDNFVGGRELDVTTKNTPVDNSFKIRVGYFEEESKYPDNSTIYDDLVKTEINDPWGGRTTGALATNIGSFLSGLPVIGDDLQQAGQGVQNALASIGGLINPALGAASNFLEPPVDDLGNIYGG